MVAKTKPTLNLVSKTEASSSFLNSPIASKSRVILKALCRTGWSSSGNLTQEIPITTHRRVLKDGKKMLYSTDV